MTTEARIGWNGEVQLSSTSSAAGLVELEEVRDVSPGAEEADEHEVTHLKSPNKYKEFIAGMKDGGEMTVQLNYVPGSATDLLLTDAYTTGTTRAIRFIIPDNDGAATPAWQHTLAGFVKRYSIDGIQPNAPITATAVFRISGGRSQAAEGSEAQS